jgi:hypothetical protein
MPRFAEAAKRLLLTSLPLLGVVWAATSAKDLSKYRNFQLGADLATIAKQVRVSPSQAKAIQRRPALIQELVWRPQPLGPSSQAESANEVPSASLMENSFGLRSPTTGTRQRD